MRETLEVIGFCAIIIAIVGVVLLVASTPFALLGWAVAMFIGMFVAITVTYFQCVGIGIITGIIINLTRLTLP